MREEIAAAVVFLSRLVRQKDEISKDKIDKFSNRLSAILVEKFKNHWYKDKPTKGQGYRCIRINPYEPIDPILEKAATDSGLQIEELLFPGVELTLWVDPSDVCCRFGESHGSFCTLAECRDGNLQNRAHTINIEELLEKERERHNQQINIVTTRSHGRNGGHFNRGLIYGGNPNFYNKHQHNFYRNKNGIKQQKVNKNEMVEKKDIQESSSSDRDSPEHINEIRQQFLNQVNSVLSGKSDASSSPTMPNSESPQETEPQVVPSALTKESSNDEKSQEQGTKSTSNSPKQSRANKGGKNYRNNNNQQNNKGKQNPNPGHYPHHQKPLQENGATNHWNKASTTSNQGKYPRSQ